MVQYIGVLRPVEGGVISIEGHSIDSVLAKLQALAEGRAIIDVYGVTENFVSRGLVYRREIHATA